MPRWLPLYPRRIRWSLAGLLTALIITLSLIPDPPIPRGAADTIGLAAHADKLAHFAAYLGLTLALSYARHNPRSTGRQTALFALVTATAVGALVELLQGFLPHRVFDVVDLLANLTGAGVAAFLWVVLTSLPKNRTQGPSE